ncbi:Fur family transcriptional regulator [Enterobacteriaceae bacterium ML5]|nr:Fur family transcriptional regulator [Enterobacteriaceae bacterium ML5]
MKPCLPCQRLNRFLQSSAEKAAKYPISQGNPPCPYTNF